MAIPALFEALRLGGNLAFGDGGMSSDFLTGAFVKSVAFANGVWTLTVQNAAGLEANAVLPPGWVVSATEPAIPYEGQGWYDTTAGALKIHDGSSFAALAGSVSSLANNTVTPANLDAATDTKQDAFLTRINALRRDLNNIATLTTAEQRTLLLSLGTLLDGPRPAPSAAYSARTWIDEHNDRAYVCRNRREVKTFVGGLWSDANTTSVGVEIAENLGDLDDPASTTDYAYTYSDNKWWGVVVQNTQRVWRETQPTTALSGRLTLTPNWTTVWLGQHRWDYNATQQLPHDALPANTDYYFFNSRTVTIRKFRLADYSLPPAPCPTTGSGNRWLRPLPRLTSSRP